LFKVNFGTDSGTASGNPCGDQFYIGGEGGGITPSLEFWCLPAGSSTPACPYWNIEGPDNAQSGQSAIEWGAAQAQDFWNYYAEVLVPTGGLIANLFGAVSLDSGGWKTGQTSSDYQANQQVVEGFLNELGPVQVVTATPRP